MQLIWHHCQLRHVSSVRYTLRYNMQSSHMLSWEIAVLFVFTYSMGCGVVPWMIAPELLPLAALPLGSALANACNWLVNFVVNTVWPPMNASLENYSFVVFAVINFLGVVFVWFCMPETTGKDLDTLTDVEQPDIIKRDQYTVQ